MNLIIRELQDYIELLLTKGVIPHLKEDSEEAFLWDPIFAIERNRVNAEICKSLIRLRDLGLYNNKDVIRKLTTRLEKKQNNDGSWNEIHPYYNKKSALVTSFVGETFLFNDHENCLKKAVQFVSSNELEPGYFLKSEEYSADCLNVNATCGAFLSQYGEKFGVAEMVGAGERAAQRVVKNQFTSGAFPYCTKNLGNFKHHFYIPCIHYQGVTIYYLIKIQKIIKKDWLHKSIKKGVKWLESTQKSNGNFDWSKSGMMFAYYLSGSYSFSIPAFLYLNKRKNSLSSLEKLKENTQKIVNRWEKDKRNTFINDFSTTFKSANLGAYPFSHKVFRLIYGFHRQYSRRRYSSKKKDRIFKMVSKVLGPKVSTIEPSANYPDLFMTSEVLDCLSNAMSMMQK